MRFVKCPHCKGKNVRAVSSSEHVTYFLCRERGCGKSFCKEYK